MALKIGNPYAVMKAFLIKTDSAVWWLRTMLSALKADNAASESDITGWILRLSGLTLRGNFEEPSMSSTVCHACSR